MSSQAWILQAGEGDLTASENEGLGDLVSAILENTPKLERLRLSSVDAVELDAKLLDRVVRDKRVMPHLHLSLQAGDDMILKTNEAPPHA